MAGKQSHNIWVILFWLGLLVIFLSHAVLIYRGKAMTRDETRNHAWLNLFAAFLVLAAALKYKDMISRKIKYLKGESGYGEEENIREALTNEEPAKAGGIESIVDALNLGGGKSSFGGSFDDFLRRFDNQ